MSGYIKINRVFPTIDMEFIEENDMEKKFKCKDEVIVRLKESGRSWFYGVVSHSDDASVVLSGGFRHPYERYDVLPYVGNEHLVGTDCEQEEEVVLEGGELVYGFDNIEELEDVDMILGKFKCIEDNSLFVNDYPFSYCLPFSKFNPDDIESTRKEILTVRNGKLVKANLK